MAGQIYSTYYKRFNGSDWDTFFFKTRISDIIDLLDSNNKIKISHLPASVSGGMRYVGTIDNTTVSTGSIQGKPGERLCKQIFGQTDKENWYVDNAVRTNIGKYIILTSDITASALSAGASDGNKYSITIGGQTIDYQISIIDTLNSEDSSSFEKGDWLIFDHYDSASDTIVYYFSVLNNTYREATTSNTGIVKLTGAYNVSSNNWGNLTTNVIPTARSIYDFVTGRNYLAANTNITGGTKCKITYDSKGLVTKGEDLAASDIPDLSATYLPLSGGTLTGALAVGSSVEVTTQLGIKNSYSFVAEILSGLITATRTYNLPDKDGTFAMTSDLPNTNNFQPKDGDLSAIAGLTGTKGLLKKTATNTWELDTTVYLTRNDLTGKANINYINGSQPSSNEGYIAGDVVFTSAA